MPIINDVPDVEEEKEEEEATLAVAAISFGPCKDCGAQTADACAACKLPMHFECGSIRDEEIISFCEECCLVLGDVDNIPGRIAKRRELCARVDPIYDFSIAVVDLIFA